MEIQGHVMLKFPGFEVGDEGFKQFATQLQAREAEDEEVKTLGETFKARMKALTKVAVSSEIKESSLDNTEKQQFAPLSVVDAKNALTDMIERLNEESTKEFLDTCVNEAGGNLDRIMEIIMPKIMEIQAHAMLKFPGFEVSDESFEQFATQLQAREAEDEEVKSLADEFKSRMKALTKVVESQPVANDSSTLE